MFTQRMQGMGDAALMAMKQLSQIVHRQAVVMGYGDAFFMLTIFYLGLSLLVLLLNKPSPALAGRRALGRHEALKPDSRKTTLHRAHARAHAVVILQITRDAFISSALSLEPEEDLHDFVHSQTARPRSMFMRTLVRAFEAHFRQPDRA